MRQHYDHPVSIHAPARGLPGGTDWQANAVKLLAADAARDDQFGSAVAIDGNLIVAGAPLDDDKGDKSGAVYAFRRTGFKTWVQAAKIVPADGAREDRFGYAVALSGEWLAVGTPYDADNGRESGSVYMYRRNADVTTWTQVKKVLPRLPDGTLDGHSNDRFGFSVGLDGDTLVVGSPRDNGGRNERGSAYVFQRNRGGADNWGPVVKLGPDAALDYDQFGLAVTVSQDYVALGMPYDGIHKDHSKRSGSAWVFGRHQDGPDAWGFVEKLDPPDNQKNDEFGRGIALSGGTLVVGARKDDVVVKDSGSAYIFELRYDKPPRSATPIPSQLAVVGVPWAFTIPSAAFGDPDVGDVLTLTVVADGGGPFPTWLTFDPDTSSLSGTPTASDVGTITLTVTATDSSGASVSTPLLIEVVTVQPPALPEPGAPLTYEQWIARLLPARILADADLEDSVWGRGANPDADDFLNFEEYAFGTPLFAASPNDGPALAIGLASDGRIAVSYRRRTNDASLQFGLEFSPDLEDWTDAASVVEEEILSPIGYDLDWVTSLFPADQVSPTLFFRVRITTL